MIERFKGITAPLAEWEASDKLIPDELWCVITMPDNNIGLKIGNGKDKFSELIWIINPSKFNSFITKPETKNPSASKFLNELGEYQEISKEGAFSLDQMLEELKEKDLEIPTKEEVAWLRAQMYKVPKITGFSSSSTMFGKVPMGTSLSGVIPLTWSLENQANAGLGQISVSSGEWVNCTEIDLSLKSNVNIELISSNITSTSIKTVTFTLSGVDSKGNKLNTKTLSIVWTHKLYWGTASEKQIQSLDDLTNRGELMQNNRDATVSFYPAGQQYSILLIPSEIDQININIVNKNASAIDHSFNMNTGNGGTENLYNLNINGILYNAYVSYATTASPSTAIIK